MLNKFTIYKYIFLFLSTNLIMQKNSANPSLGKKKKISHPY